MPVKLKVLLPTTLAACLVLGGVAAHCRAADDPTLPTAQDTKAAQRPPAADARPR